MVSKSTKVFEIDGIKYQFNFSSFNTVFNSCCNNGKKRKGKLEEDIASELHISKDAVHNWRNQSNGPSDIEMIITLGEILKVDYMLLLKKNEESKTTMTYTGFQTQAIKRVYDAIIDFLDEFLQTDGFNDLWDAFVDKETTKELIESLIYEEADKKARSVDKVLTKEYFYLHDLDIFKELSDAIEECNFNGHIKRVEK